MKAEEIKSILEEKLCPVHDIHPVVEITGSAINISCCCDYFTSYCKIEADFMMVQGYPDGSEKAFTISHN